MGEIRFVGTGETRGYPYLVCKKKLRFYALLLRSPKIRFCFLEITFCLFALFRLFKIFFRTINNILCPQSNISFVQNDTCISFSCLKISAQRTVTSFPRKINSFP